MTCPICLGIMSFAFSAKVLNKYDANYEYCCNCGFLHTQKPIWLDEAYSSAIATADTGLVMRNIDMARKLAGVLYLALGERGAGRYLDAAGGYGMLTRMMRDMGFDFFWSDKYSQNFLARSFEYSPKMGACRATTAIEVMEHLVDPLGWVKETLEAADSDALIFSTELYEGQPPKPEEWWYYAFETGQHIGFFQRKTLEILGQKLGLHFASANGIHILSKFKVNEQILRFSTSRVFVKIAPSLARLRLGSKTLTDHQDILRMAAHPPLNS